MSATLTANRHATLYDLRDLDLLVKMADAGGGTSTDVAELFGDVDPGAMASRLAWMRRFGMVDRDEESHAWSVSAGGRRVVQARLRSAQERAIQAIPDESMIEVMAHVATRYRLGDPILATLLRREFLFGTQRR